VKRETSARPSSAIGNRQSAIGNRQSAIGLKFGRRKVVNFADQARGHSRFTIHDSRFTIHDSRFTIHDSRFTIHDQRPSGLKGKM
jgi:hypothetical protein